MKLTEKILGPSITPERYENNEVPGVVVGLAWTSVGDDYYFESSNASVVVPEHKHSWGTYHEAIQGNCVTKGQTEYWECGSSACNERLDATLNVIEDITGEFDANKHEKTASWVKTAETHKQVYDCCGAEKTAEEAHVYGIEGDARFTCGVCGYVDTDKKAAIEEAEKKISDVFMLISVKRYMQQGCFFVVLTIW